MEKKLYVMIENIEGYEVNFKISENRDALIREGKKSALFKCSNKEEYEESIETNEEEKFEFDNGDAYICVEELELEHKYKIWGE